MPKNKDLKRVVRTRMQKTGETYTAARSQLVEKRIKTVSDADLDALAGMSSAAVEAKTGRTWKQWVLALDASGAISKPHRDIARWVHEEQDVPGWWAQTVTVGYERIRGLRQIGQRRGGGYEVTKSKTFAVPIARLYQAFAARQRKRWMGEVAIRVKKATPERSMRIVWEDGTPVEAYFWEKGANKSQLQLQHRNLSSRSAADELRQQWADRLTALGELFVARD